MKNNIIRVTFFLSLFFTTAMFTKAGVNKKKPKGKPNVILIVVDDMGWTDLTTYGSDFYQTPNIDKLAQSGIKFTDSYATCTVCSPTRASLMTGKYPARLHLTDWIAGHKRPYAPLMVPNWTQYLVPEEHTLAETFKDNDYKTYHVGKWHLGDEEKDWPEHHGFDKNIAGFKAGSPKAHRGGGYFSPYNNPRLEDGKDGEYLTERLTDEVTQIIEENKKQPFFINYWFYNVHMPLQAKQEKIDKYKALVDESKRHRNPTYASMVEHVDEAVGRVLEMLKKNGLEENTLVILTSDNGGLIGKNVTDNSPLRSGKGDMYEGGVRIPLIMKWPNKIKGNSISNVPSTSADIYPTIMELIGLKFSKDKEQKFDGISLSEYVQGGSKPSQRNIYWHYPHYHTQGAVPYSAIRSGDWKLIRNYESNTTELYNLKEDIGEKNNLINKQPTIANKLTASLDKWLKDVDAQYATKNKNFNPKKDVKSSH